MTAAVGLLGYLGTDFDPARLDEAQRRAPWRGSVSDAIEGRLGCIVGLGSAQVGCHRHVAVAIHGRIDNRDALASELDGDRDDLIALLGEAYLRHGDEFARRLLGDFAILVLDERRGALLGSRDWIGTRPLFWGESSGAIAFGSEVKQVLALLTRPHLPDHDTLHAFELNRRPGPDATFACGASAVPPNGQVFGTVSGRAQAWSQPVRFRPVEVDPATAPAEARRRLENAVRRRTAGHARVAAMVSGGMDSTSVAATAAHLARTACGPPVVAGLTLTFPDAPSCDESVYARQVAERSGIPWVPVPIEPLTVREGVRAAIELHDGPIFPSVGPEVLICRAEQLGVDMLLSGQLADHWLGQRGYELELAIRRGEWVTAARYLVRIARRSRQNAILKAMQGTKQRARGLRAEAHFEGGLNNFWTRAALEVEERQAMHQGIQVEFPFADEELARYLAGLPVGIRSYGGLPKGVLRHAMQELLPASVLSRVDKTTFGEILTMAFEAYARPDEPGLFTALRRYGEVYRDVTLRPHGHPQGADA